MLASHFHDEIVRHAFTALVLIGAGLTALVVGALIGWRSRRAWPVLVVGLVVMGAGVYRVAEAGAMSHNHLCHAHNSDACSSDHARNKRHHTHWFGGRTAGRD